MAALGSLVLGPSKGIWPENQLMRAGRMARKSTIMKPSHSSLCGDGLGMMTEQRTRNSTVNRRLKMSSAVLKVIALSGVELIGIVPMQKKTTETMTMMLIAKVNAFAPGLEF
jgi:hypothetical protein